jgi:hypothetical protein
MYNLNCKDVNCLGIYVFRALKENNIELWYAASPTTASIRSTIKNKTKNESVRAELLKEVTNNFDRKAQEDLIRRFGILKDNFKNIDWKNAEFTKCEFLKKQLKSDNSGFEMGTAILSFKSDGNNYVINLDKVFNLDDGWKGMEFYANENASIDDVQPAVAMVPEIIKYLPGNWTFNRITKDKKDVTETYADGKLNSKPIILAFEGDGYLMFQKGVRDREKFSMAQWEHVILGSEQATLSDVKLRIIKHKEGGKKETTEYKILNLTEKLLILESVLDGIKMEYVR